MFEGALLSDGVLDLKDKLGEIFLDRFKKYAEEREPVLSLSMIGKPLRQLWYQLKGYKGEVLSPETKMKFLYGDILEALVLFLAMEAGHEVTMLQAEVEVDGVPGHIDAKIDGVLVDVKSCSTYSFKKFEERTLVDDDPFGYVGQLAGYSEALGNVDAAFLAIDKVLGKLCLCRFSGEDLKGYNVHNRIQRVQQAITFDTPPERCYEPKPISKTDKSGNLFLGVGCSYCAFKQECWKDANDGKGLLTYFYSTGPKFAVHIEKEPRVARYEDFPVKD